MKIVAVVILDSNILIEARPNLRSASMQVLLDRYRDAGMIVCLPKLVVSETLNHWSIEFDKAYDSLTSSSSAYSKIGGLGSSDGKTAEQKRDDWNGFEKRFQERLLEAGIEELPLPSTSHEILVNLDMKNRKPFGGKGSGYRDAMIWFSVLERAKLAKETVAFLTKNHHDFAKSKEECNVLHEDLVADVSREGLSEDSIMLVNSLSDFNKDHVQSRMSPMNDLALLLISEEHESLSLRDLMDWEMDQALLEISDSINPSAMGLSEEVTSCEYIGGASLMDIVNVEAKSMGGNQVLLSIDAYMYADFLLEIDNHNEFA